MEIRGEELSSSSCKVALIVRMFREEFSIMVSFVRIVETRGVALYVVSLSNSFSS